MTVMVAEQGAATAEAGAAEASRGARQQLRSQPRRTAPRPHPAPAASSRQGGSQRSGGSNRRPRVTVDKSGGTSYQAVVLAEFVAAILLVAATPFAKKDSPGISPYAGSDLLQLVAITLVYFILALISGANRGAGRFAAWFGALILLTVGLAEAARLAKLLNVFGLQSPPTQAAQGLGNQSGGPQNG